MLVDATKWRRVRFIIITTAEGKCGADNRENTHEGNLTA